MRPAAEGRVNGGVADILTDERLASSLRRRVVGSFDGFVVEDCRVAALEELHRREPGTVGIIDRPVVQLDAALGAFAA